ncbi:MAG: hypothetical protein H7838_11845, partial [Magnetococcus sp. DMHC-8]
RVQGSALGFCCCRCFSKQPQPVFAAACSACAAGRLPVTINPDIYQTNWLHVMGASHDISASLPAAHAEKRRSKNRLRLL